MPESATCLQINARQMHDVCRLLHVFGTEYSRSRDSEEFTRRWFVWCSPTIASVGRLTLSYGWSTASVEPPLTKLFQLLVLKFLQIRLLSAPEAWVPGYRSQTELDSVLLCSSGNNGDRS